VRVQEPALTECVGGVLNGRRRWLVRTVDGSWCLVRPPLWWVAWNGERSGGGFGAGHPVGS